MFVPRRQGMKQKHFSLRRRQVIAGGVIGAGVMVAPVMAAHEPLLRQDGERMVVSGRIVSDTDGHALAGAQIEIWQADAQGVRDERTRVVITADGDGRYFAKVQGSAARLHYRVSHRGHTTRVTQLHATGARQRSVTMTRDDAGATRAAFELTLVPRNALASTTLDYAAL
jgi:protocatechuate 3,4-dioxygenase beta subunit